MLDAERLTATFFVLTEQLPGHGGVVDEAIAAGHEIQLHGDCHEELTSLPLARCVSRLADARRRLEDAIGAGVTRYRSPYGRVSPTLLRAARRAGLEVVLWSHDPRDWSPDARVPLSDRLGRCTHPGAIVLMHDAERSGGGRSTASALASALRQARDTGLSIGSLARVAGR